MVNVLEEDLAQKRKQVLTLKQSMDKQSSSHVGLSQPACELSSSGLAVEALS